MKKLKENDCRYEVDCYFNDNIMASEKHRYDKTYIIVDDFINGYLPCDYLMVWDIVKNTYYMYDRTNIYDLLSDR